MSDRPPPVATLYLKTELRWGGPDGVILRRSDPDLAGVVAHVITAWNPGDERPTSEVNDRADERLRLCLDSNAHAPQRVVGSDPDSGHYEESWLVTGLTDEDARSIGARFGQVAVFRIANNVQTVLACSESWSVSRPLD